MTPTEVILSQILQSAGLELPAPNAPSAVRFELCARGQLRASQCSHDLYQFLIRALEYDEQSTLQLHSFRKHNAKQDWKDVVEFFCEEWNIGTGFWVDSYEDGSLLSSNVRYYHADEAIFLRVHSGSDARTGYSDPIAFREIDDRCIGVRLGDSPQK